ncbi:hypothetical protein GO013_15685 [Pseudodesulfovibrio sp. JC047]|uniref:hypothetical protein n=1 Tax=Pseudodesulfovibrio sp. JC047 TaxID=2683199 RepID=UPI0013CF8C0A|nr:hypothetical protein [Pseudodesulfovibrio sp. JC047]NDV20852.1 hypothetical protein [Pseudodesulfovibrio sp. JC047]
MFLARFQTKTGPAALPIDRATVVEGMRLNDFNGDRTVKAINNLSRGIPVIVGECVIEKINRKSPRWN